MSKGLFVSPYKNSINASWEKNMMKKMIIAQSIMWAAAILVVAIVDDKSFAVLMLVALATTSLMALNKLDKSQSNCDSDK